MILQDVRTAVDAACLGAGDPFEMYEDYIEGKREIKEINMEFVSRYFVRG